MKYQIKQLIKNGSEPFQVNEKIDFSKVALEHNEIRKISPVLVIGTGQLSNTNVIFDLNIKCDLILPCALTLDDVLYKLDINTKEIYSFKEGAKEEDFDYDISIVKGQTIEIASIIWQNIVLNIPLRVISEGAYERMQRSGDNWQIIQADNQEAKIDPRFAVLKDLLKK